MTRTRPIGTDLTTLGYYDASFIKLRSVNLGYNFSNKVLKKLERRRFIYMSPFKIHGLSIPLI